MKKMHIFSAILASIIIAIAAAILKLIPAQAETNDSLPPKVAINNAIGTELCNPAREPQRIGIQVGHWKNDELPEELAKLRTNDGAAIPGKQEWEVAYEIAATTKSYLEVQGYTVDLLPATIPPGYCAQAFVAIHLDASTNTSQSGYKAASYWQDQTGLGPILVQHLETAYKTVGPTYDPTVTANMRGYYAFNNQRFTHSINPNTPGAIFETGYLTNPSDAALLINHPEVSGKALAQGIINFLDREKN